MAQVAVRTAPEGSFRITVNDKILVHLVEYSRYREQPEAPREVTQQGISEILGARRSHVSLALSTLRERGLVEERIMRIIDEVRRRKGYFLSPKGYETARKLVEKFRARVVRIEEAGGVKDVRIADLPEILGERYHLVDVLCCVNREGNLDIAQLTGQQVQAPVPQEETPKVAIARATTVCPTCFNKLEFPYDTETLLNVVCGFCGNTFRASIGTPVYGEAPSSSSVGRPYEQMPKTDQAGPTIVKLRVVGPLLLGTILQLVGAVVINLPFGVAAWCGLTLPSVVVVVVTSAFIKDKVDRLMTLTAAATSAVSFALIFVKELALVGLGFLWASPFLLIAIIAKMWTDSRIVKPVVIDAYAVSSLVLPMIGWWGTPIAFGLIFSAGVLLASGMMDFVKIEGREKELLVSSMLVILLSIVTFAHWIYGPQWDTMALARVGAAVATVYAFVLLAKPISRRTRAEFSAVLGASIMALSVPTVIASSLVGWTADLAGYLIVFGVGLVYLANKIHKLDNVWVQVCLGLGLSIVVLSLATLGLRWLSLSMVSRAALLTWAVAGAAVCSPRLVSKPGPMLASTRTGAIAAIGTAVVLAGVYMLTIGMAVEGAIEVVLGTPLVGYAILRSGAPWRPKLAMCCLLMLAVGITWASFITEIV